MGNIKSYMGLKMYLKFNKQILVRSRVNKYFNIDNFSIILKLIESIE